MLSGHLHHHRRHPHEGIVARERARRASERSDHDLYRALRFLAIFSYVFIASVSCTFLDIFRVLLFAILVRASRSDAKTGFLVSRRRQDSFDFHKIVEYVNLVTPRTRQTAATDGFFC